MPEPNDINDLITSLSEYQRDVKVEEILQEALADPIPTEERLQQIENALETFKELGLFGGGDARDVHLLLSLGKSYERLSHLEKAFESYSKALDLAERHDDNEARADLLGRLGRVLSHWQRWDEALEYLDRSDRAFEELGDDRGRGQTQLKRGTVYARQGDYERAGEAFESAATLSESTGNRRVVAGANTNLAILATIRGDLNDACSRYENCIEAYKELKDDRGLAGAYHNLGMTHADMKNYTAAMDYYEKGFEVARRADHLVVMANIHLHMAELMLEMGNSMMVPFCCSRALDIYKKTGNRLGEADTYRLLGNTFVLRRDWATAEQLFKDSLQINEEYGHPLGVAESQRDLGKLYSARGRKSDALECLRASLGGFRKLGAQSDIRNLENLIANLEQSPSEA